MLLLLLLVLCLICLLVIFSNCHFLLLLLFICAFLNQSVIAIINRLVYFVACACALLYFLYLMVSLINLLPFHLTCLCFTVFARILIFLLVLWQNCLRFELDTRILINLIKFYLIWLYLVYYSSLEPLIKSWFVALTTQMPIFVLFGSAGVLFDGAFSLWVSLTNFITQKTAFAFRVSEKCFTASCCFLKSNQKILRK